MSDMDILIHMDICDMNILYDDGSRTPTTLAIVGFMRSKGYPHPTLTPKWIQATLSGYQPNLMLKPG
jgi:hypothetical protein